MVDPISHPTPAQDAAARERVLAAREDELARLEVTAVAASHDPAERVRHRMAADLHERAAASHRRDALRHRLEVEVEDRGVA